MIAKAFEQFAEKAPAALMFRSLFARVFSDDALDQVFSKHRERQVDSPLLFSYLVSLLVPVITGSRASVNASHRASDCKISRQAVYDKLKGIEPAVETALVRSTVGELRTLQIKTRVQREDTVPGYHTFVIDGKSLNGTEHRLEESRFDSRCPLPGRCITMLDTRFELFSDVEFEPYAYRCERKVLAPMFNRLEKGAIYVADRNFSDGEVLSSIAKSGAFFVIRQHGACPSWRELPGEARITCNSTSTGESVYEQKVEVQTPDGAWLQVRRITVVLAKKTRNGDTTLNILTNLPPEVLATKIAVVYHKRWRIETCFGYLSQALNAEIKALCYPGAAGLCFCLALVLFNIMSTLKALLAAYGKQPEPKKTIELSYYYVAHEIAEYQGGMNIVFDERDWRKLAAMTMSVFAKLMKTIATHAQLKRYRKDVRGPSKPRPKRKFNGSRHVATQALLNAR
jgi:Transposase DDE domain